MTLINGQKAFMACRLGVARMGATRLGWYQPWIKVVINGVDHTNDTRVQECTITDELNAAPNTAIVKFKSSFTPTVGADIKIFMGDTDLSHQIFGGRILSIGQSYEGDRNTIVVWSAKCIDYTWLLNRRKVLKKYTNLSATAIVLDLMTTYTSGFTTTKVVAGLPTIDEITFTNEDMTDALTRIAERIGGYWYVDYASDLHFFLSETVAAGSITDAAPRGMSGIVQDRDLSQVATRVTSRGGGSNALIDVAVGSSTLPLEDDAWYAGGGGTVECGQNRITYTGVQSGGAGSYVPANSLGPPPTPLSCTMVAFGSAFPNGAITYYVFTFYDSTGESTKSGSFGQVTNGTGTTANGSLTSIDTGPSGTIGRRIYRAKDPGPPSGPYFRVAEIANNSATNYTDNTTDANLGGEQPPVTDTTGMQPIAAGSTTLRVAELSQFLTTGWVKCENQILFYTGRSGSSGPGDLTGIPAGGLGSITSAISVGSNVTALPHLTGCSGINFAIKAGDQVNVVVTVNDATAQTNMAGFVGGDGIHEMSFSDGTIAITEATARANAELALRKDPLVTVRFQSRDQTLQSGRDLTITITTPAISVTTKIQRVTYSQLGLAGPTGWLFPLRDVEASSRRYSFEDVLRRIKGVAS